MIAAGGVRPQFSSFGLRLISTACLSAPAAGKRIRNAARLKVFCRKAEQQGMCRRDWLALALIVAVAAVLRALAAHGLSLSYDELQSVTHAHRPFPLSLLSVFAADPHPPFFYLLLSLWLRLGTSDGVVLAFPALLGTLLVPSVFFVCNRLYDRRVAFVAAAICAVHPFAIHWSVFARMYALVMLAAVWAWYGIARLTLEDRPSPSDVAIAAAGQLALVWAHGSGAFALAMLHGAVLMLHLRDRAVLLRWARRHVVIGLLCLPALYSLTRSSLGHLTVPGVAEVSRTFALFVGGMAPPAGSWPAALLFVGSVALLLVERRHRPLALALLVIPFVCTGLLSYLVKPVWHGPRSFAFVLPFAAIAGALLAQRGRRERVVLLAALPILLLGTVRAVSDPQKSEHYVDAARIVSAEASPGDRVVLQGTRHLWAFQWYFSGPGWDRDLARGRSPWEVAWPARERRLRKVLCSYLLEYGSRGLDGEIQVLAAHRLSEVSPAIGDTWLVDRRGTGEQIASALVAAAPGASVREFDAEDMVVRQYASTARTEKLAIGVR
jgi:hypothetical protein